MVGICLLREVPVFEQSLKLWWWSRWRVLRYIDSLRLRSCLWTAEQYFEQWWKDHRWFHHYFCPTILSKFNHLKPNLFSLMLARNSLPLLCQWQMSIFHRFLDAMITMHRNHRSLYFSIHFLIYRYFAVHDLIVHKCDQLSMYSSIACSSFYHYLANPNEISMDRFSFQLRSHR